MQYIKLSDILELKSPYKELIEMEANQIKEATGGVVVPDEFAELVEEQNHRIVLTLGCSQEFANVLDCGALACIFPGLNIRFQPWGQPMPCLVRG